MPFSGMLQGLDSWLVIYVSAHISTSRIENFRCPETSVTKCKATPRDISEDQSPKCRTERMR